MSIQDSYKFSDGEWDYDVAKNKPLKDGEEVHLYSRPTNFNGELITDVCGVDIICSTIRLTKSDAIALAKHFGLEIAA